MSHLVFRGPGPQAPGLPRWPKRPGLVTHIGNHHKLINFLQLHQVLASLDGCTITGASLKHFTVPHVLWTSYTTKHQRMAQVITMLTLSSLALSQPAMPPQMMKLASWQYQAIDPFSQIVYEVIIKTSWFLPQFLFQWINHVTTSHMPRQLSCHDMCKIVNYCQTSNISCTLIDNKIVDHSDIVGASPVGIAPTTSSFSINTRLQWIGLGKDNCNMRWETLKFWDLVPLILEVWW